MADDPDRRRSTFEILSEQLVGIVAVGTFGVGVLAVVTGVEDAWMIFVVGWFVLVPILAILSETIDELVHREGPDHGTDQSTETEDALATLRDRYARGEIDELTFERKVEALLETETVADAQDAVDRRLSTGAKDGQPHPANPSNSPDVDALEPESESES